MKIKAGVKLEGLSPQIVLALVIAGQVYKDIANKECVITSVSDGKHSTKSLHYSGFAVDLRINNITVLEAKAVLLSLQSKLGDNYDVVLEIDHIHLEYDPK